MRRRPALPRIPEKVEQAHIVKLLRTIGATVYVLGHPSPADGRRFRGTGQTAGLPDLFVFLPRGQGVFAQTLWIEVKAKGGRLRPEQAAFQELCEATHCEHLVGGYDDVIAALQRWDYLRADQVPHYRTGGHNAGA